MGLAERASIIIIKYFVIYFRLALNTNEIVPASGGLLRQTLWTQLGNFHLRSPDLSTFNQIQTPSSLR